MDSSRPVLVGVSGGPDSLCLLDLLHSLGYPVVAAHLNHHLRPEADDDARAVRVVTEARGIPFVLGDADVMSFVREHALSIEEAARTLRYQFLFDQARLCGAQAVAVAHTADDQVETVLMHLLRGAGLAGLKGMETRLLPNPWSREIPLVRPLLAVWREEVLDYCGQRGLQPVFDRSNQDTTFFRNRLRHELIPVMQDYNPNIKSLLWRMAQVLAGDAQVLDEITAVAWDVCQVRQGDGYVSLDVEALRTQPIGVQRSLLRRAIAVLRPGLRDIGFETVERAVTFMGDPPRTRQRDLAVGLRLFLESGRLWVAGWEADLLDEGWPQMKKPLDLNLPGEVALPGGWQLRAELADTGVDSYRQARENADPFQAWIDPHGQNPPLVVRARRPGDRFQPLGMDSQTVKLSDLMINLKLPRRARAGWPLVCTGEEVIWVPGYHLAHPYRLTPESQAVIHLQLCRQSEE